VGIIEFQLLLLVFLVAVLEGASLPVFRGDERPEELEDLEFNSADSPLFVDNEEP
jgi:hypothetical protein